MFASAFAFDTETTLIDPERDWLAPAYVLGAAYDGQRGYLIRREHVAEFLRAHADLPLVFHNAVFDLAVLQAVAPGHDLYVKVDRDLVLDTQLLHRLLVLATAGHTSRGKGQSTLETCAELYLGVQLPKSIVDSEGADVRLSYSKWLNRPPESIEAVYLEYLGKDVIATFHVYRELMSRLRNLLSASSHVWGAVSPEWTITQVARWGPQTHHIQLKAAIVLRAIKANGLTLDQERREELQSNLTSALNEYRQALREFGYLPGEPGSGKALQEIMKRLERSHPEYQFPKTSTGKYVTKRDVLEDLAHHDPFIENLLRFKAVEKLCSTFVAKLGKTVVHPSFDPLMVTGRTSSFGEINAQNLPKDDRVRSCFIPSAGHVYIDADFNTVELATLAQSVQSQFHQRSAMAAAINAGQDLHRLVASRVTGKPPAEVSRSERSRAKPINFGKPGGMGDAGLQRYARASYEIELSDEEVKSFSDSWFELFPEMRSFLEQSENPGSSLASCFNLTPQSVFDETGIRSFLLNTDAGLVAGRPLPMLGWMLRKVLLDSDPKTAAGVPYDASLVEYFWRKAESCRDQLSGLSQAALRRREPSYRLLREILRLVEQQPCMTLTGRLRASASYCARHNTLFQGLAADGAKLALWKLWRAGFRLVNFVHDEVLVEVPDNFDLRSQAEMIKRLMIEGMREVVPDIRIDVTYAASKRWYKEAEATFDEHGRLLLWAPSDDQGMAESSRTSPRTVSSPTVLAQNVVDRRCA